MGKFDRRHSMKMRRRKAQVKKKERVVRQTTAASKKVPAQAPAKKAKKAPAVKVSAA